MKYDNEMTLTVSSKSCNESFARSAVGAFCAQLNPTIEEIGDIKTAVSEGGYQFDCARIQLRRKRQDRHMGGTQRGEKTPSISKSATTAREYPTWQKPCSRFSPRV